jgi:hypothetical protein
MSHSATDGNWPKSLQYRLNRSSQHPHLRKDLHVVFYKDIAVTCVHVI